MEPIALREVLEDGVVSQKIPYPVLIALIVVVAIVAVTCFGYVLLKKLVPLISRLRRSNYLENEEIKQDSKPTIDENYDSNKALEADAQVWWNLMII